MGVPWNCSISNNTRTTNMYTIENGVVLTEDEVRERRENPPEQ